MLTVKCYPHTFGSQQSLQLAPTVSSLPHILLPHTVLAKSQSFPSQDASKQGNRLSKNCSFSLTCRWRWLTLTYHRFQKVPRLLLRKRVTDMQRTRVSSLMANECVFFAEKGVCVKMFRKAG